MTTPHRTLEGYHDIYPHEYVKSWKERSQEKCHDTNLVDMEVTTLTSHIIVVHVPPFSTKTCFTESLRNNSSRFNSVYDIVMGQYMKSAEIYGPPNAAFVYVKSRGWSDFDQ